MKLLGNVLVLVLALSIGSSAALAVQSAYPKLPADVSYPWLGKDYLSVEGPKVRERVKRNVASSRVVNETMMSAEMTKFRDKILAIKKAEEIDPLLVELEKNYETYPADLKFVAAHLIPLKSFKSLIWRMTPMVEKPKIAHSYLLTVVQRWAEGMKVFMPREHWDAGFAYITEPFVDSAKPFSTIDEFQYFVGTEVYAGALKTARRLSTLDFSKTQGVFDNRIFFGKAAFEDGLDRYRVINQPELNASIAFAHQRLASLSMFCAYKMDKALDLAKDLGQLYGVDALLWDVDGAPAQKRAHVIHKSKYRDLYTLTQYGPQWTKQAYLHMQEAVRRVRLVWEELRNLPADEFAVLNSARVIPWSREIELNLKNMEAMMAGETAVHSRVSGEVLTVNLPAFYLNPPIDLKAFIATQFDESPEKVTKGNFKYSNYFRGRPIEWDLTAYKQILPGLTSGKDVGTQVRLLRESWGGWGMAIPLSRFVGR